jgi:hypothetical protein
MLLVRWRDRRGVWVATGTGSYDDAAYEYRIIRSDSRVSTSDYDAYLYPIPITELQLAIRVNTKAEFRVTEFGGPRNATSGPNGNVVSFGTVWPSIAAFRDDAIDVAARSVVRSLRGKDGWLWLEMAPEASEYTQHPDAISNDLARRYLSQLVAVRSEIEHPSHPLLVRSRLRDVRVPRWVPVALIVGVVGLCLACIWCQ